MNSSQKGREKKPLASNGEILFRGTSFYPGGGRPSDEGIAGPLQIDFW